MKTNIGIYSVLLVAGTSLGVSTFQQARVNSTEINNQNHWKSNNALVGDCLENAEIFSTYAYQVSYVCENSPSYSSDNLERRIDLNGDSVLENTNGYLLSYNTGLNIPWTMFKAFSETVISELVLIDVTQINFENNVSYSYANIAALIDMNNDGLLDAIIRLIDNNNGSSYYCVLNISTPPAATCDSDLNGNGSVEVNDLMQIVSDWGPCE